MIKLSYDIKNYRQDILDLVSEEDTVIELGCHLGGTTRLIPDTCNIIAVDNSPDAVDDVGYRHPADARLRGDFLDGDQCGFLLCFIGIPYHSEGIFICQIRKFSWNKSKMGLTAGGFTDILKAT